jgi:hypothetical protein
MLHVPLKRRNKTIQHILCTQATNTWATRDTISPKLIKFVDGNPFTAFFEVVTLHKLHQECTVYTIHNMHLCEKEMWFSMLHFHIWVKITALYLPPLLLQVSDLAVPVAHCGSDNSCGLPVVLLTLCLEQPQLMTGVSAVDSTLCWNVRVGDVCVPVHLVLCSYEYKYFLGNCAVPWVEILVDYVKVPKESHWSSF